MPVQKAAKTTTVRLSVEAKAKLDKLQAKLTVMTGQKMTKEELLEQLIDVGLRDPADALPGPPGDDEGWKRLTSLIHRGGPPTDESDIDQVLYGWRK